MKKQIVKGFSFYKHISELEKDIEKFKQEGKLDIVSVSISTYPVGYDSRSNAIVVYEKANDYDNYKIDR